jgi:hypothetical protein
MANLHAGASKPVYREGPIDVKLGVVRDFIADLVLRRVYGNDGDKGDQSGCRCVSV